MLAAFLHSMHGLSSGVAKSIPISKKSVQLFEWHIIRTFFTQYVVFSRRPRAPTSASCALGKRVFV
jgi:hypothetical protein